MTTPKSRQSDTPESEDQFIREIAAQLSAEQTAFPSLSIIHIAKVLARHLRSEALRQRDELAAEVVRLKEACAKEFADVETLSNKVASLEARLKVATAALGEAM